MLYKLLRDNVETGPYTKSELMGMNLLSSDFIRPDVDGSNWVLANKFTELKDKIVENAPKPKYKITADGKLVEISNPSAGAQNSANITGDSTSNTTDNAPFKRTPSALPKKKIEAEENKDKPFDYQPAKETALAHSKTTTASTFAGTKNDPAKPKQKKKSANVLKEFIIPLAILGGLFAGWSIYNSKTGNGSKETRETLNTILSDFGKDTLKSADATGQSTAATPVAPTMPVPTLDSAAKSSATPQADKKKTDSTAITGKATAYKDSVALAAKKAALIQEQKNTEKTATETKSKEEAKPISATKPAVKEEQPKTAAASPPAKEESNAATAKKGGSVRDYVRLDLNKPSKEFVNAKIRVNNISKTNLNVAMVRVRYLDEKSNVIKSETLQIENIPAGRSVIVGIPDNKSAAKISYGVTMISGDDVYIMRK